MISQSDYEKCRLVAALVNALENEFGGMNQELLEEYPFLYMAYDLLRAAGWSRDRAGPWRYFG